MMNGTPALMTTVYNWVDVCMHVMVIETVKLIAMMIFGNDNSNALARLI